MKFAIIICLILMLFILAACGTQTPETPTPGTKGEGPTAISGELVPANTSEIVSTHVEFLIDNSNSIEKDCGVLGVRRYDFVNFVLDIFRITPSLYSANLFVGAGSFGNDHVGYKEEIPIAASSRFKDVSRPLNNQGNSQNISDGIARSIERLEEQNANRRYLVIITDGKLTSADSWGDLRVELKPAIVNNNLSVLVGLICPDDPTRKSWQDNIENENIEVFSSLEDTAQQLLGYLNPFLPKSITLASRNRQSEFSIAGYQTNLVFRYWNAASNATTVTLTDDVTYQIIQIIPGQPLPTQPILYIAGCPNHIFSINPILEDHWLLFVQPMVEQNLDLLLKLAGEEPVEIVNNQSARFYIEISEKSYNQDLRLWQECFYPRLSFSDQETKDVGGFVTPVPSSTSPDANRPLLRYDAGTNKVFGEIVWHPPPFQGPEQILAKVQIVSLSNDGDIVWEAALPVSIPIKFEAKFETHSPTTIPEDSHMSTPVEFSFGFSFVSVEPRIFLITEFGEDKVVTIRNSNPDDLGFPFLEISIDGQDATEIDGPDSGCSLSLDVPGETYACIYSDSNPTPDSSKSLLFRDYLLKTYNYIVSRYGFTQLLFYWDEGRIESRAIAWKCSLNPVGECTKIQPPPHISLKE